MKARIALTAALCSVTLCAQSAMHFEVATIRRSRDANGRATSSRSPSGLYSTINFPLRLLIRNAFGLPLDDLLIGVPSWVEDARYDINAKAERETPTMLDARAMLQALLAERFKMTWHTERRDMPVYTLVFAKPDRTLGPQLKQPSDCAIPDPAHGMRMQGGAFSSFTLTCMPFSMLPSQLLNAVHRPVIDRTGLSGDVTLNLEWDAQGNPDSNRPSIFTAVQEQLGLKLNDARGPVDVIVIDHIEPPELD